MDDIPLIFQRLQALAERDPRRAVRLARRKLELLQADDPIVHAWTVYTLGWALLCWERFDEARSHLGAARQVFATHGYHLATLRCDYALLLADLFQRASPDEQEFAALAIRFVQAGAVSDAVRVGLYQAVLLDILGRPHDARDLLDRLAPAIASGRPIDQARSLYILGSVAISQGDYAHAEALLAQAEQSFAALHCPLDRARCWFQQAWAALRQEKLDLALANYRRAQWAFTRLDLPVRMALCDKGLGLLLTRMGRYDDALWALLRALRLFTEQGRTSDIGACQLNLGNIYFYTGLWDIALAYYSRAESLYERVGVVGKRIIVQRNRAMIYRIQGRLAETDALLTAIEAQAQVIGDQAEIAEIWGEQAGLLAKVGRYEEAMLQYQRARDLFDQLGSQLDVAECQVEQGWLALRHGEVDTAYTCFRTAAPLVALQPYYRWRADYGLARCAEICGDVTSALKHYRSAITTVAELRRRLISEMASSGLYTQAQQLHNDSLRLAAACGTPDDVLTFGEWQRALVLQRTLVTPLSIPPAECQDGLQALQLRIAALLSEDNVTDDAKAIDAALANYGDLLLQAQHTVSATSDLSHAMPEMAFDLARLRAQLDGAYGADWTALVYMLSDQTLLIGVVTTEGLALEQTPYDAVLRRLVDRATRRIYQLNTYRDLPYLLGQTAQPWEGLCALGDRLLPATVQARLHPLHRLLIVPAGPLHTLPWGTLRLGEHWLAERSVIHLIPSLTVWQSLAARPATHSTSALLVGCSTFGARAPTLPAVAEELATIAACWPGESLRIEDAQATREALQERSVSGELAGYGLLHIASHAQLLPRRGLAAHLKLWDGDLWLSEVADLRLGGALVVLSACDGAMADALPGEEVLSLSWAFLAAGASGVLASLWPVEDHAVHRFMALFYEALRQHGDAGLALAHVQRTLILRHRIDSDPRAEPMSWGSFVLMGGGHVLW